MKDTGERSKVTKSELMVIFRKILHSQKSYLVQKYITISDIEEQRFDLELKVKVTTQGQRSQTWRCLRSLNASCCRFYFSFATIGLKHSMYFCLRNLEKITKITTKKYAIFSKPLQNFVSFRSLLLLPYT